MREKNYKEILLIYTTRLIRNTITNHSFSEINLLIVIIHNATVLKNSVTQDINIIIHSFFLPQTV